MAQHIDVAATELSTGTRIEETGSLYDDVTIVLEDQYEYDYNLDIRKVWAGKTYGFHAFYHPYTCLFRKQLNRYGIDGLLDPGLDTEENRALRRQKIQNEYFGKTYLPDPKKRTLELRSLKCAAKIDDQGAEGSFDLSVKVDDGNTDTSSFSFSDGEVINANISQDYKKHIEIAIGNIKIRREMWMDIDISNTFGPYKIGRELVATTTQPIIVHKEPKFIDFTLKDINLFCVVSILVTCFYSNRNLFFELLNLLWRIRA